MILLLFLWIVTFEEDLSRHPLWGLGLLGSLAAHSWTLARAETSQRACPLPRGGYDNLGNELKHTQTKANHQVLG